MCLKEFILKPMNHDSKSVYLRVCLCAEHIGYKNNLFFSQMGNLQVQ